MRDGVFMRQVRAAGLAGQVDIARILLWGGLAVALVSAMARTRWLLETGMLFAGIGALIIWRVLKSFPPASQL